MNNRNHTGFFLSALLLSPGALGLLLFLGFLMATEFNPFGWFWLFLMSALHIFNAFHTTLKNEPEKQIIAFDNRDAFVDRLDAILTKFDYQKKSDSGSTLVYGPSFWTNWANRKIVVDLRANEAEINGPAFALNHIEKRFRFFRYPGISLADVNLTPIAPVQG